MFFSTGDLTSVSKSWLVASNFIEYVSIAGAMSHSYIFPLYVLILYFTIKWHEKPDKIKASAIGFIIGLATISRPTEAIMLLIPLLWNTQVKEMAAEKWQLVKKHKDHLIYTFLFGFIAVFPQLLYWKITSGSFVYDVGSAWNFLNPNFEVLFGWVKGWFIYTPITILFIAGMFYMNKFPFKKSVITFCLLNIYIIIAYRSWRYGGGYSCRTLVQSYPVFALAFTALIDYISLKKWRYLFYALCFYLSFVNLFQLKQFNEGIFQCDEMNRKYYCSIYLNPHPTPIDMSLLDTEEKLNCESKYEKKILTAVDSTQIIQIAPYCSKLLFDTTIGKELSKDSKIESWLKIEASLKYEKPLWGSYINSELQVGDSIKHNKIRLDNAISPPGKINEYAFYVKIPDYFNKSTFRLSVNSSCGLKGVIKSFKITYFNVSFK